MKKVAEEKPKIEKRCCFGYKGADCTERVEPDESSSHLDVLPGKSGGKIFTCEDFHPCTEGTVL